MKDSISNGGCMKKQAFTLAEVLITLGIIGVVAAMTMPTLIQKQQKKVAVTKLKQTYSMFGQAFQRAVADYGDSKNWSYDTKGLNNLETEKYLEKYLFPYIIVTKKLGWRSYDGLNYSYTNMDKSKAFGNGFGGYFFYLKNGVMASVHFGSTKDDLTGEKTLNVLTFWIDINGRQKPNVLGQDAFNFTFDQNKNKLQLGTQYNYTSSLSRQQLITGCYTLGSLCAPLIQLDGWEIKEDYPW